MFALVAAMMCALGASAAEAYACYTPSNTTLTFYYDNYRSSRTGTTFNMNTGNNQPGWQDDDLSMEVTRVVFNSSFASARPTSTYQWFAWMYELQSIVGLNYLNTTEVTTMAYMFCGCQYESLDLSHFNTSKVTDMSYMFDDCSVTSLNVSGFNTTKVTNMSYMFEGCSDLTGLDVSSFNTSNVTNMHEMFASCSGLTSLDVSGFNTSKVTDMVYMFAYCSNLVTIYAGSGWSTSSVTSSSYMFKSCIKIKGGKGTAYNANHVDKAYAHIDGGISNPGYLTDINPQPYACYTPSNSTLTFYYDNQRGTRTGTTYDLGTYSTDEFDHGCFRVVFHSSFASARPTSTANWFFSFSSLESISGLNYLNTSNVTDMSGMFYDCMGLTSLDLSNFNTAKVTDMSGMFWGAGLQSLDLSSFNTSNVTNMHGMFYECANLTNLNVSSFNTSKVTDMSVMFNDCSDLTSLDLSSFNTSKVTNMSGMFYECENLTNLNVSSFNTSKVANMDAMFFQCAKLTTIYAGNGWTTAAVNYSEDMFTYCTKLVGGKGTTYDSSHTDKAYAHIDGGISNPGYLTDITPQPYACYTPSNTTLTFYYDSQRGARTGTTYDAGSTGSYPAWYLDGTSEDVTKVVFDPTFGNARPTSTAAWFMNMTNLGSITGTKYLNTSEVTDMTYMYALTNLLGIELGYFNTSKVKYMYGMFGSCNYLSELDLSSFNTSQVTDMGSMFRSCSNLETIYVGNDWYTYAVTSSSNMFKDCTKLVGGRGTTYDANHVDKAYAHIDGGASNPGYFTEKVDFIRGDVNGDGHVDVEDVTMLIAVVLGNASVNPLVADVNFDNNVDIEDVTTLISGVLSGELGLDDPHDWGQWLVLYNKYGDELWYELHQNADGGYTTVVSLSPAMYGTGTSRFYIVDNGIPYGASQANKAMVLDSDYSNPLTKGKNCYTVPAGYHYSLGMVFDSSGKRYATAAQGSVCN